MELYALDTLQKGKNLLAFSAGSDSTALFFLLVEHKIPFDIAIVNYNLRPQSKEEVAYAKELANKYKKRIFIYECHLQPPAIEQKAREIRYNFFASIIKKEGYSNLITAHQLNDQFEWFMMQLAKGAGVVELIGMDVIAQKESYTLVRPLLFTPKEQILSYLQRNKIHYFFDKSNENTSFKRNLFRKEFCDPFMQRFAKGVQRSFLYLSEDKKLLTPHIFSIKKLFIASTSPSDYQNLRIIDKMFKKLGYILTSSQKKEILKQRSGVIGGKIAFAITKEHIFAAPYIKVKLPKTAKEEYRKKRIPSPLRGYLFQEAIDSSLLDRVLEKALCQSPYY